ncbi:Ras-related protein Rab-21 [Myotis brandtii]|nr:Ras-related protein Rab-21 [Myotis brandtii]
MGAFLNFGPCGTRFQARTLEVGAVTAKMLPRARVELPMEPGKEASRGGSGDEGLAQSLRNKTRDEDAHAGASFLTKKLNIGGKRVNLAIWDTAGQERFHALGPIYYRDSNGAILVYDITDEDSFQKVKNWVKELRKMLGNEICLCIVGNKIDLEKERHVSIQEAESYAESVGAKHYHTSAKQNKGIEELFLDLCKRMIETAQVDERAKGNGSSQPGAARRGVQIIDDEPQVQSSGGGCCSSG